MEGLKKREDRKRRQEGKKTSTTIPTFDTTSKTTTKNYKRQAASKLLKIELGDAYTPPQRTTNIALPLNF